MSHTKPLVMVVGGERLFGDEVLILNRLLGVTAFEELYSSPATAQQHTENVLLLKPACVIMPRKKLLSPSVLLPFTVDAEALRSAPHYFFVCEPHEKKLLHYTNGASCLLVAA